MEAAFNNFPRRRPCSPVLTEAMDRAVEELMRAPMVDVPTFKTLFRVSTQSGYRAAQEGRFGAVKIGAQYRFPSSRIREALGLQTVPMATVIDDHAAEAA